MSDVARDFVNKCLTVDPAQRMTAEQCLAHPWLSQEASKPDQAAQVDLLPHVQANVKSRVTLKGTVRGMIFASRLKGKIEDTDPETVEMRRKVASYKEDAEAVSTFTPHGDIGQDKLVCGAIRSAAEADRSLPSFLHARNFCSIGKPFRSFRTHDDCLCLTASRSRHFIPFPDLFGFWPSAYLCASINARSSGSAVSVLVLPFLRSSSSSCIFVHAYL